MKNELEEHISETNHAIKEQNKEVEAETSAILNKVMPDYE
jgi:hypothetical protein